jgi:hypothetical protein
MVKSVLMRFSNSLVSSARTAQRRRRWRCRSKLSAPQRAGFGHNPELRDRIANERYTLANLEVDVGRGEDAKALLESDLRQVEVQHGKNSSNTVRRSVTSLRTAAMPTITIRQKSWLAREVNARRRPILPANRTRRAFVPLGGRAQSRGSCGVGLLQDAGIEVNRAAFSLSRRS